MRNYVTEFIGTFFLVLTIGLTVLNGTTLAPLAIGSSLMLTADFAEFLALREGLFLEIATIVETAGSAFAQPNEFVYVDRKVGDGQTREPVTHDDVRLAR